MSDLIRREDVMAAISKIWWHYGDTKNAQAVIAALPAVTVGVKPLAWDRYGNAQGYGCKYMVYETRMGWNAVLYPQDAAHFQIATDAPEAEAVAACDNDHRARILSALEPVAAPRRASKPLPADGFATSDAEGQWCRDVDAGVYDDPAAIREAALREALKALEDSDNARCASCGHPRNNHPYRHPFISMMHVDPKAAILALIQKGTADDHA